MTDTKIAEQPAVTPVRMWRETIGCVLATRAVWAKPALILFGLSIVVSLAVFMVQDPALKLWETWSQMSKGERPPFHEILPQLHLAFLVPAYVAKWLLALFLYYFFGLFFLRADATFPVPKINVKTFFRTLFKVVQVFVFSLLICLGCDLLFSVIVVGGFRVEPASQMLVFANLIIAFLVVMYLMLRWVFVYSLCFLKDDKVLHDSWALTKDNLLSILGNFLVIRFPLALLQQLVDRGTLAIQEQTPEAAYVRVILDAGFDLSLIVLTSAFFAIALRRLYQEKQTTKAGLSLTLPKD